MTSMPENVKDTPTNGVVNGTPPVEVVRYSDPVDKEDVLIDTTAVQERYKFFEEFRDAPKEPKRFEMTPPRETNTAIGEIESTPSNRDPNVIRSSDVIDDIPKTDTAKKMLGVFKQLESQSQETGSSTTSSRSEPKPLKRVTPPRELDTPNHAVHKTEDKVDAQVSDPDESVGKLYSPCR
jgi:hypothetical protein